MTLKPSEMPVSFYGQALLFGAKTNFLNPPNNGQGVLNHTLGRGVRVVARLVYQLACAIITPLGFVYHEGAALKNWIQSSFTNIPDLKTRRKALAWEHFKAGVNDVSVLGVTPAFFLFPNKIVERLMSNSLVRPEGEVLASEEFHLRRGGRVQSSHYNVDMQIDLARMDQGLYRYDMLVRHALLVREEWGSYPSLDDGRVKQLCCLAAHNGAYGVGASLFDPV